MRSDKEFLRSMTRISRTIKEVSDDEIQNSFFKNKKVKVSVTVERDDIEWVNELMSMFTRVKDVNENPDKVEVNIGDTVFEFISN